MFVFAESHKITFKNYDFEYLRGWVDSLPERLRVQMGTNIPKSMRYEEPKNPDTNLSTESRNVFVYAELDYGYIEKICTMYRRKVVPVCIICKFNL